MTLGNFPLRSSVAAFVLSACLVMAFFSPAQAADRTKLDQKANCVCKSKTDKQQHNIPDMVRWAGQPSK